MRYRILTNKYGTIRVQYRKWLIWHTFWHETERGTDCWTTFDSIKDAEAFIEREKELMVKKNGKS